MEEDAECADDEVEATAPHEEIPFSPSDSEDSQLPRYRSRDTWDDKISLLVEGEPLSYSEVVYEEVWRQAMNEEM